MLAKRIIPCLDVTGGRVVKGVNFVNLIDAGDPVEAAIEYDRQGADDDPEEKHPCDAGVANLLAAYRHRSRVIFVSKPHSCTFRPFSFWHARFRAHPVPGELHHTACE